MHKILNIKKKWLGGDGPRDGTTRAVEEKFGKYFGYLARCEARFCTNYNPKKLTIFIKMMSKCRQNAVKI